MYSSAMPTTALVQPVALSTHPLRARLHSVGSSRESTYVHSCGEQLSTSEPLGSLGPVPMLLAPNGAGLQSSQQSPRLALPSAFPPQ